MAGFLHSNMSQAAEANDEASVPSEFARLGTRFMSRFFPLWQQPFLPRLSVFLHPSPGANGSAVCA